MKELEQATETLMFERQDDQAQTAAIPASTVGEDLDIDYWTLLMEARIVGSAKDFEDNWTDESALTNAHRVLY